MFYINRNEKLKCSTVRSCILCDQCIGVGNRDGPNFGLHQIQTFGSASALSVMSAECHNDTFGPSPVANITDTVS